MRLTEGIILKNLAIQGIVDYVVVCNPYKDL